MVKKKSKGTSKAAKNSDLDAEIDDWMQTDTQDQNLVPCPRCGHYIMDEDVYDRLCDGVDESSGEYCPKIYHNICLDKEEMALDSGGFWFCPDCKANHFSSGVNPIGEDIIYPDEPVKITINHKMPNANDAPILMSALDIPTKGSKGTLGAASKAASFKKKKTQREPSAFVAPAAYLEVLGVTGDSAGPPPSACQTPRGPVSARGSPKKGRQITRGQVTDKVGLGLWSVKTPTSELADSVRNENSKTGSFKMWSPDIAKMDSETRDLYLFVEGGMHEAKEEDQSLKQQQEQLARLIEKRDFTQKPLAPIKDRAAEHRLSKTEPKTQVASKQKSHKPSASGSSDVAQKETRAASKTEPPAAAEPKNPKKEQKSKACIIS